MKHSLRNTFLLYGKTASSGKKIKKHGFYLQKNNFYLKFALPNFNTKIPTEEKTSEKYHTVST